ncbi:hypothetical protein B296_00005966 [Ensete ventricosum]|uniref:Uncharacterized protein n=1 Tax=Ensete ventricosum TaxID=4639 RepID=A0A427ASW1_ENSVE|nr:hypothetical protein B296_00005966 [Ensete ventricosum]
MHESRKPDLCQEKSYMMEAQGQIRRGCMSRENLTHTKINPLWRKRKAKCA